MSTKKDVCEKAYKKQEINMAKNVKERNKDISLIEKACAVKCF